MTTATTQVRRTGIGFLFMAALVVLLIVPGGISAQGTESQGDPVWSADMLVVAYTEISIGAASADLFSNVGGSGNLQIRSLWSYVPNRDLRLAFTDGVPDAADMTLKVGDLDLEFPSGSSGEASFKWTDVDLDWEDGETIAVSIVRTSTLTEPVGNTPATGAPSITGTPQVDQTLTADISSIADEDGLGGVSYSYQWIRSDNGADSDIAGATSSTYTLVFADQGKTLKVKVSFTDNADNDETLTSEPTEVVTAAPNRVATGEPTISGTPQVNQTLTASTSAIADQDGLHDVSYNYQWIADDTDIQDATDSTYTPSVTDVGNTIKVKVSFTDDHNNAEARTSLATTAVLATVPTQPLSLTVATGDEIQELDASWQAPSSDGGSAVTGYKVQWKESADSWDTEADVSESTVTGITHTITGLTGGVEYDVQVIATNVVGDGPASVEATGTPMGAPTISGTAQVGQTLTADTSSIDDANGLANVAYSYQWISSDNGADTDIAGETDSTYTLVLADQGKTIKVKVTFTDDAENEETLTSVATVRVAAAPNREATGAPTIMGLVQAGETLTVDTSKISDVDGIDNAIFEYQWISNDGTADTDITGGRSSTYVIKPWDLGKYIKVRVSFTDDAGNAETLTSIATTAVEASPNEMPTGAVLLSGMAEVGQALTAHADGIHDANGSWYARFSYQWIRNDGTTDVDIQDATNPGYVLTDADEGKTIKVRLSFTDDGANQEILTSSATTAVTARPSTSDLGEPTALTVGWSQGEEKGLELSWIAPEETVTSYQILRQEIPTRSLWREPYAYGCTPLMEVHIIDTGGDATTYTDTDVAEGATYTYSVRAINSDGVGRKSSSSTPNQYRPHGYWPSGVPGSPWRTPTNLASSQIKNGIGLTWDAPEGEVTGYQILRRSPEQCEYGYRVYVENTNSTDTHWADRDVVAGTRYEYHVRAINDVGVGRLDTRNSTSLRPTTLVVGPEPNNEATGTPTITGTAQVGQTLTADPSSIADADGMRWARFSYQWLSSQDTEIEGATSPTYTLQASDASKVIKVRVDFMDDSGYKEYLRSPWTEPVGPRTPSNSDPTGTPEVDQTLHVAAPDPEAYVTVIITSSEDTVSWSDPDECTSDYNTYLKVTSGPGTGTKSRTHIGSVASGSTEAIQTISYSWTVNSPRPTTVEVELYCGTFDASSSQNVLIESTYLATQFSSLREGTYSSAPLTALGISSGTLSPAFDRGINRYTAEVPNDVEVITLDPTVLTGYQTDFVRNPIWGVVAVCGRGCNYGYGDGTTTGIVLADADEETEGFADEETEGFQINLNRGENRLGIGVNKGNVAAGPGRLYYLTVTVENSPATGQPTISGTPQVGETLTADTSAIADRDGLANVSYSYQWIRSDGNNDTDIPDATDTTYTLVLADLGKTIKVQVSFTDDADNDETLTSEATVAVAATVPSAPQSLTVTSGSQIQELDVSWQAPSANGGSGVTGYKVQWKESADSWDTETDVSETTVTGTTHTITSLTGGVEYAVRVIATNVAGDGPASTEARATPADSPASGEEGTETVESDSTAAWTATLTVGVSGSGSEAVWGYSWFLDGMGTLDERTYSEGDQTIEVMAILLSNDFVAFNVRPHPSVDFVLTVDGTEFASADASEVKSRTLISYVWATTLDWAVDDRVALSLTLKDTDSAEQSEPAENTPSTGQPTISGTPQVDETLTAGTSAISDEDGLDNVSYQYQWLRDDADVAGQTNSTYELVSADEGKTIKVRVTFNDDAGNAESLTSVATTAVAAQPTSLLTASFANVPADHNGSNFTFQLSFSENVEAGYARIRDHAFTVTGATIDSASRITQGSNQGWNVEVNPTGNEAITITLPETTDCDASGAICTDDSRKLSHPTSATVAGPPAIAVSDATVQEAEGAVLVFTATLSHASSRTVTVDYATSDGTAVAGSDYTAASGTLTFNAGDTSQTVQVTVLTDSDDEGQETITLTLSNPSQATLDDATGTGTIKNGEPSSATQDDPPAKTPAVLLTASFSNMPATHNGSAFTFDLTFSEEFGISYVTLRDDAFSVTDGEVTSARRLTQGSNIRWTITVTPDSAADVTIVLPVTTDCNANGAVCTADGRKLSNRLEFTVSGPGQ